MLDSSTSRTEDARGDASQPNAKQKEEARRPLKLPASDLSAALHQREARRPRREWRCGLTFPPRAEEGKAAQEANAGSSMSVCPEHMADTEAGAAGLLEGQSTGLW